MLQWPIGANRDVAGQVSWRVKAGDARSRAPDYRDFHVRFLALLWVVENESLYDSCDNRGTGGARKRADGTQQGWWWQARKKSDEQIAAEQQQKKNEENAYKDALKKIQPAKPADPWGSMR